MTVADIGPVKLWASITTIDLGELAAVATELERVGVEGIHVDMGDGVFVPDLTFGWRVVRALTDRVGLPVEAHLMVTRPDEQLRTVAQAGARRACFHLEVTQYPTRVAALARAFGVEVGLALNPSTAFEHLSYLSPAIDYVNVLTSEPDDVGEQLLPRMCERVRAACATFGPNVRVQVDGGVSATTIADLARAGASDVVVGRALLAADSLDRQLDRLRSQMSDTRGGQS